VFWYFCVPDSVCLLTLHVLQMLILLMFAFVELCLVSAVGLLAKRLTGKNVSKIAILC